MTDLLSVVIPTRNRAELLRDTLESICNQTINPDCFEVLVIDNGSTDNTAAVSSGFTDRIQKLKNFVENEPGLHAGRHRGTIEATGNNIVFADDDIVATPGWLEAIAKTFEDDSVAMVGGNNLPLFVEPPPQWLEELWQSSGAEGGLALPALSILELPGPRRPLKPEYVWGCNFAIRKRILLEAGGFHPDAVPQNLIRFRGDGETHVARHVSSQGYSCIFQPGATVHHKVTPERMTIEYFKKRGFNQGISDSFTELRGESYPNTVELSLLQKIKHKLHAVRARLTLPSKCKPAVAAYTKGYAEGFQFHQAAYENDPEVKEWVRKINYLPDSIKPVH